MEISSELNNSGISELQLVELDGLNISNREKQAIVFDIKSLLANPRYRSSVEGFIIHVLSTHQRKRA